MVPVVVGIWAYIKLRLSSPPAAVGALDVVSACDTLLQSLIQALFYKHVSKIDNHFNTLYNISDMPCTTGPFKPMTL